MSNRTIPRAEWLDFFRAFSERHQDWLVTIHIVSPSLGSQIEAHNLPLEGIVAAAEGDGPISIYLGRAPNANLEHEVPHPIQVWVELSDAGAEEALEIESQDGTKTIVQFRTAPPPETVDGILQA